MFIIIVNSGARAIDIDDGFNGGDDDGGGDGDGDDNGGGINDGNVARSRRRRSYVLTIVMFLVYIIKFVKI